MSIVDLPHMLSHGDKRTSLYALDFLRLQPLEVHAKCASSLVWCAVHGFDQAVQYVQELSCSRYFQCLVAPVQQFPHCPYVDRLHMQVLKQMVPYLIEHGAVHSLQRVYSIERHSAIQQGVLTALLCNHVVPTLFITNVSRHLKHAHDAIHFMHVYGKVPRNHNMLDQCVQHYFPALQSLVGTTAGLQQQMVCAQKYLRRRSALLTLVKGTDDTMLHLRRCEFAWRLVFSFL